MQVFISFRISCPRISPQTLIHLAATVVSGQITKHLPHLISAKVQEEHSFLKEVPTYSDELFQFWIQSAIQSYRELMLHISTLL